MSPFPHTRRWQALLDWWRWVEPWYLAYALLGITVAGMAPILLPVAVSRSGGAVDVGLVMAAMSVGGMLAPVWGSLADHKHLHRGLLVGGLGLAAVGLAVFPFTASRLAWVGLALVQGIGASAAGTVANLLVVEAHPQSEWNDRVASLQTFYDGGTVAGLLLVTGVSQVNLPLTLLVAAGLTALAAVVAWNTTRTPSAPVSSKPVLPHATRQCEWGGLSPQGLYRCLLMGTRQQLRQVLWSPFGLFLLAWVCILLGNAAFFALYPVLMQHEFGLSIGHASATMALAMGLELAFYTPAGHWANRYGPLRLMQIALGARLLVFLALFGLGLSASHSLQGLPLLLVIIAVLPWPLFSVSSTALTARLSPGGEGAAMGTFGAATSVAAMSGAMLGGWLASHWGYNAATGLAVVGLALGLLLASCLRPVQGAQASDAVME